MGRFAKKDHLFDVIFKKAEKILMCFLIYQGEKIKTELAALVRDLPADFDCIAASAMELEGAVQYYDDFVKFLLRYVHMYITVIISLCEIH